MAWKPLRAGTRRSPLGAKTTGLTAIPTTLARRRGGSSARRSGRQSSQRSFDDTLLELRLGLLLRLNLPQRRELRRREHGLGEAHRCGRYGKCGRIPPAVVGDAEQLGNSWHGLDRIVNQIGHRGPPVPGAGSWSGFKVPNHTSTQARSESGPHQ